MVDGCAVLSIAMPGLRTTIYLLLRVREFTYEHNSWLLMCTLKMMVRS